MLWTVLGVFSVSYLIRGIWDQLSDQFLKSYALMLWSVAGGVVYDCIPVSLLLYYHYRNFSQSISYERGKD